MVVSIHKHSTAGPVNVCHLSQCAWCGPEWPFATPNSYPLCQSGIGFGATVREHPRTQALPHHGARGGCRCWQVAALGRVAGCSHLAFLPRWKGLTFRGRSRIPGRPMGLRENSQLRDHWSPLAAEDSAPYLLHPGQVSCLRKRGKSLRA